MRLRCMKRAEMRSQSSVPARTSLQNRRAAGAIAGAAKRAIAAGRPVSPYKRSSTASAFPGPVIQLPWKEIGRAHV